MRAGNRTTWSRFCWLSTQLAIRNSAPTDANKQAVVDEVGTVQKAHVHADLIHKNWREFPRVEEPLKVLVLANTFLLLCACLVMKTASFHAAALQVVGWAELNAILLGCVLHTISKISSLGAYVRTITFENTSANTTSVPVAT